MRDYVYTAAARLDGFSINDTKLIQNSVIPEEIALLVLSFKTIYKIQEIYPNFIYVYL